MQKQTLKNHTKKQLLNRYFKTTKNENEFKKFSTKANWLRPLRKIHFVQKNASDELRIDRKFFLKQLKKMFTF